MYSTAPARSSLRELKGHSSNRIRRTFRGIDLDISHRRLRFEGVESENQNSPPEFVDCEELAGDTKLASKLGEVLGYTQLLLDDDENLTKTGNLTSVAKGKLRERITQVLGTEQTSNAA